MSKRMVNMDTISDLTAALRNIGSNDIADNIDRGNCNLTLNALLEEIDNRYQQAESEYNRLYDGCDGLAFGDEESDFSAAYQALKDAYKSGVLASLYEPSAANPAGGAAQHQQVQQQQVQQQAAQQQAAPAFQPLSFFGATFGFEEYQKTCGEYRGLMGYEATQQRLAEMLD